MRHRMEQFEERLAERASEPPPGLGPGIFAGFLCLLLIFGAASLRDGGGVGFLAGGVVLGLANSGRHPDEPPNRWVRVGVVVTAATVGMATFLALTALAGLSDALAVWPCLILAGVLAERAVTRMARRAEVSPQGPDATG